MLRFEHPSVLDTMKYLERLGFDVTYLPVGIDGVDSPDDLREAITSDTILAAIMAVNNEIGTINPMAKLGDICRQSGLFGAPLAAYGVPILVHVEGVIGQLFQGHDLQS